MAHFRGRGGTKICFLRKVAQIEIKNMEKIFFLFFPIFLMLLAVFQQNKNFRKCISSFWVVGYKKIIIFFLILRAYYFILKISPKTIFFSIVLKYIE